MSIKRAEVSVPALQTAYTADPSFNVGFPADIAALLMTTTPGAEVFLSFDGTNDHVHLVAGSAAVAYATSNGYDRVWLRGAGIIAATQLVAESDHF